MCYKRSFTWCSRTYNWRWKTAMFRHQYTSKAIMVVQQDTTIQNTQCPNDILITTNSSISRNTFSFMPYNVILDWTRKIQGGNTYLDCNQWWDKTELECNPRLTNKANSSTETDNISHSLKELLNVVWYGNAM